MKSKIQKWGNSLAVRIPKTFVSDMKVKYGSEVEMTIDEGRLSIVPVNYKESLKSLVAKITDENTHDETETGDKVGKEYW